MKREKAVKSPDLSILKKQHINKWVALSLNYKKIIAVGENLSDVLKKVGNQKVFVTLVQPNIGYILISKNGSCLNNSGTERRSREVY